MTSNNTSVPTTSTPSMQALRAVNSSTKMANIFLALLVFSGLGALVLSFVKLYDTKEKDMEKVLAEEKEAQVPKRINAQVVHGNDYIFRAQNNNDEGKDEEKIDFSLFTIPSGADVYRDGIYIGTTPIDQKKLVRSDNESAFAVLLEGYEVERINIQLDESYSNALTLTKSAVVVAPLPSAAPKPVADGVVANKAVVITDTAGAQKQHKGKGKKEKESSINDFVLPD